VSTIVRVGLAGSTAALDLRYPVAKVVAGTGDGVADDRAAIASADSAAAATGSPVLLRPGTYRVASNLTVASPVTVQPGAILKPASGVTVTLAGGVDAPRRQIFDHSIGGLVVPQKVDYYHPAWWGPVGTTDDTVAWTAMSAALVAGYVRDTTTSVDFGQRVLAPAGVNRFFGVTLESCHLVSEKGVSIFYPSGSPTTGTMLTVDDYCTITGGYWRTNGTSQAITLLNFIGYRSRIENVFVVPNAAGAIGISLGTGSGSSTPVLRDIQIHCSNVSAPVGTGIYVNSPDSEMANIWIGPCDKGINFSRGDASITNLHVWGCNTGLAGSPDAIKINGLYLDSNRGWGAQLDSSDRCIISNFTAWNNGASIGSTGGIRVWKSGSPGCRDNIIGPGVFDDNTGVGLSIDGATGTEVTGVRFTSRVVMGGGSPVTDTGVRVTSAASNTRLTIRGRRGDHVTALVDDQATSTMLDLGTIRKTLAADQTFTSTTGLGTILSAPLAVNETWQFDGVLYVDGSQAADLKVRVQATSATGATGWFGVTGNPANSNTSTTAASFNPTNAFALAVTGGSSVTAGMLGVGTIQAIPVTGYVTTTSTAGTLELQASQNTSDATVTTVHAGSWLRLTRIA
jgi:hypothetical protein